MHRPSKAQSLKYDWANCRVDLMPDVAGLDDVNVVL